MWEYANFSPGKSIEFPEPKVSKYRKNSLTDIYLLASQWGLNSNLRVTGQGLLIRNMIVKTCSTTKLRSLGVNVHLKGRLVGNSCLWIFTRVDNNQGGDIPALRPVCMIRKMVDTQRCFCVFGHKSPSVSYTQNDYLTENGFGTNKSNGHLNDPTFAKLSPRESEQAK